MEGSVCTAAAAAAAAAVSENVNIFNAGLHKAAGHHAPGLFPLSGHRQVPRETFMNDQNCCITELTSTALC